MASLFKDLQKLLRSHESEGLDSNIQASLFGTFLSWVANYQDNILPVVNESFQKGLCFPQPMRRNVTSFLWSSVGWAGQKMQSLSPSFEKHDDFLWERIKASSCRLCQPYVTIYADDVGPTWQYQAQLMSNAWLFIETGDWKSIFNCDSLFRLRCRSLQEKLNEHPSAVSAMIDYIFKAHYTAMRSNQTGFSTQLGDSSFNALETRLSTDSATKVSAGLRISGQLDWKAISFKPE